MSSLTVTRVAVLFEARPLRRAGFCNVPISWQRRILIRNVAISVE